MVWTCFPSQGNLLCERLRQWNEWITSLERHLQDIYFKTIMPSLTYCILIWRNCPTTFKCREKIFSLDLSIIFSCWMSFELSLRPSFSYFYKKSVFVFMDKVYFDSLSFSPDKQFSKRVSRKSLRAIKQMCLYPNLCLR